MTTRPSAPEGARWLRVELDECIASWQAISDIEGPRSAPALRWEGRADEMMRVALHFGLVDRDEAQARVAAFIPGSGQARCLSEPDGDG